MIRPAQDKALRVEDGERPMDGSEEEDRRVAARPTGTALQVAPRRRRDVTAPIRRREIRPLPEFTGLQPTGEEAGGGYHEFLPEALRIIVTPPSRRRRAVGYVLCGSIVAALLWSVFGDLRHFAIAPGQLEAHGGVQVVEPREAGQVSAVRVQNGDSVKQNDIVVQLDPTAAQAAKTIVAAKLADARAHAIRHGAAAFVARAPVIDVKAPISWPADIPADVRTREESVLRADLAQLAAAIADFEAKLKVQEALRDKYVGNIAAQKTLIDSRTQRTAMHETLEAKGWDSRAMVLQSLQPLRQDQVDLANYEGSLDEAKASIPVLQDQIAQARQSFIADNASAAAAAERQTADLVQQLKKVNLNLANLSLRAPVTGTVQSIAVMNVGQALKVGEQLMQIVPSGAPLEISAYVLNTDIGFVKVGAPVVIKVDTFPYTRYGTIAGHVTHVGADAVTGAYAVAQEKNDATTPSKGSLSVTNASQQMSDLVFPVTVVPDRTTIDVEGRSVPLTPGMSVVAEIETQRQRPISYILYPLTRVFSGPGT